MAESNFSGSSAYTGILNVDSFGNWNLQVRKNSGTGYWANSGSPWSVTINGHTFSGSWTYDFRGVSLITIASQATHGAYPRPALGQNVNASWSVSMQSGIGTSSGAFVFFAAGTATTPPAPSPVAGTPDQITPTSMRYRFSGNGDGGSGIIRWEYQYSTTPGFTSGNSAVITGDGTEDVSGLTPNTTYYFRSRGVNAVGNGAWSATSQGTTLPATPPGMALDPAPSGVSMSVTLTPPGGATGVTKYRVEYRIGTGAATAAESATSPIVVNGLVPGTVYQWRASAFFGTYQSPWTDWTPVAQNNPNTQPGEYFDGSTAPRNDLTFAWTGSANNSTSNAVGPIPSGWLATPAGGGGSIPLQRITGGFAGSYAARMVVREDIAPGALEGGFWAGMRYPDVPARAQVEEGGRYVGSMYVRPSKAQSLSLALLMYGGGPLVSQIIGPDQMVTDITGWTRLVVDSGVIPAGIDTVAVVVRAGAVGYTGWLSGEWLDMDAAMVTLANLFPYFDGDTTDTASYDYQWLGTPNASVSARYELDPVDTDPLADPDCPPMPPPPSLPTVPSDCIDEVGTWRRYTIQVNSGSVRQFTASLPALTLNTLTAAERQVRIRYYPNPDGVAPELLDMSTWEAEQIITYIPPFTSITLDGVSQLVWAEVDGGEPIAADRLLYGTDGMPATWPVLTCGWGYVITLDVPLDAPSGNLTTELFITQRM